MVLSSLRLIVHDQSVGQFGKYPINISELTVYHCGIPLWCDGYTNT